MARYNLIFPDDIYNKAYEQFKKKGVSSMGKYLNIILKEAIEKEEKKLRGKKADIKQKCFLCGHNAFGILITKTSRLFACKSHYRYFKDKYSSYISGFKELKQ